MAHSTLDRQTGEEAEEEGHQDARQRGASRHDVDAALSAPAHETSARDDTLRDGNGQIRALRKGRRQSVQSRLRRKGRIKNRRETFYFDAFFLFSFFFRGRLHGRLHVL